MKLLTYIFGTILLLLVPCLKAQALQWVELYLVGGSVGIDVESIHLVRTDIYQYVVRLRVIGEENLLIGRSRVNCAANSQTMLIRHGGVSGDGRMHALLWSASPRPFSAGWSFTDVPYNATPAFVCNFISSTTQQIPNLPQNWDYLPASYIVYQTNDGTFLDSDGNPINGITQLY